MNTHNMGRQGFTLIEVIVTIVIAAVALAAILPFLGDVFLRSHEPRVQLAAALDLQTVMEDIVATHTNGLEQLRQEIGAEDSLIHGRFRIQNNRYVDFSAGNETSATSNTNLLKVTIRNELGESLTRLFSVPL